MKDPHICDFRPRFRADDAEDILTIAAHVGVPPAVWIRMVIRREIQNEIYRRILEEANLSDQRPN